MPSVLRAVFVMIWATLLPNVASAETWLDVPYQALPGVPADAQTLDIRAPEGAENLPVMVMIHGGAWQNGNKTNAVGQHQADFFLSEGYVHVSINYRLAPDYPFPAHAEDAAAALAFIHQNIVDYGGDPSRINVMGHSAGAHIAALVSIDASYLRAHGLGPRTLSKTVLLDGAAYDLPATARRGRVPRLYHPAFGKNDPAVWAAASPRLQVKRMVRVPDMLIIHVPRKASAEQSEALAETLNAAGHSARVLAATDRKHSTLNKWLGAPQDKYAPAIAAFLKEPRA